MAGALTAAIAAAFSGGAAVVTDEYFEYTTLLLPGNGTNGAQNNTFLDGSTNNFNITRNGNTTQGTFSPFSQTGWGNYFEGVGFNDNITVPSSANLGFGTGDFTIECWVYNTAYTGTNNIFVDFRSAGADVQPCIYVTNAGVVAYFTNNANRITSSSSVLNLNQWYHVALARSGTTTKLFLNGSQVGSDYTDTNNYGTPGSNRPMFAGNGTGAGDSYFAGYISNLRVTKGRAVYTGAFTPPTTPLTRTTGGTNPPQGTECSLLICQSNRFLDSNGVNVPASSPLTITVNGTVSVVAFSPFNPTASWSAANYGGSGYFDGSGDYLSVADNAAFDFGSGDFTIECWAYTDTFASQYNVLVCQWDTSYSFVFRITSSLVGLYINVGNPFTLQDYTASVTNTTGQWNHFCVTRSGSTLTFYKNGASIGTSSISATITNSASNLTVGVIGDLNANTYHKGYISGMRLIKGTAVAPTITTPPTAVSGTSLLLNFTNAGIYDATSKNDLETVGNAQISTTQSKWGGSSMSFDGTGDYLVPNGATTDMFAFGNGNFTIEFWIRFNALSGFQMVYDSRPSGTDGSYPMIYANSTTLIYYVGAADRISSSSISTNTWYHIAVARSGTSTKMFIDGTQSGSTYTDSTNYINPANRPLIGANGTNLGSSVNGYIQDLRITKGYARYTANFTAPTAAFPTL